MVWTFLFGAAAAALERRKKTRTSGFFWGLLHYCGVTPVIRWQWYGNQSRHRAQSSCDSSLSTTVFSGIWIKGLTPPLQSDTQGSTSFGNLIIHRVYHCLFIDTVILCHFSQGREEEEEEIQNALTLGLKFNESWQIRVREWHWKILSLNTWDLMVKVIYLLTPNIIWLHNTVLIQR